MDKKIKELVNKYIPQFEIRWFPKEGSYPVTDEEIEQWKRDEQFLDQVVSLQFRKAFQDICDKLYEDKD